MSKFNSVFKLAGIVAGIGLGIGAIAFCVDKLSENKKHGKYYKPVKRKRGFYERNIKRPLDCALSGISLLVLSPVLGIVSLLVRKKIGSPVFFKQIRPGRYENNFELNKFRTMSNETDENGDLLPDSERLTSFGKTLRSTSLDEVPELVNIFKGDMAIIGPRPLATEYTPYYNEQEHHRHDVRPGLTGLAQVSGRNNLQWEDRFKYDLEYVDNITFWGDVKIILKTVLKVFKREDVTVRGETMIKDFNIYRREQWEGGTVQKFSELDI